MSALADPLTLVPSRSMLLVIDIQEKLASAMDERDAARCAKATGILLDAAAKLGVPTLVTEQYPKGLGSTLAELASKARANERHAFVEKLEFDATKNDAFESAFSALKSDGRTSVVVAGMEAHICVYQTARALAARGMSVHVASDATSSRRTDGEARNAAIASGLWARAGAVETCAETVVFDWIGKASGDDFKFVSKLVR